MWWLYSISVFPVLIFPLVFTLCITVILGKSHYILYGLVAAMQPRMLVTFDEELRPLPVSVRVGQVKTRKITISIISLTGNSAIFQLLSASKSKNCGVKVKMLFNMISSSVYRLWMSWARRVSQRPSQVSRPTPRRCCWLMERGLSWPQRSTSLSPPSWRALLSSARIPTMKPRLPHLWEKK